MNQAGNRSCILLFLFFLFPWMLFTAPLTYASGMPVRVAVYDNPPLLFFDHNTQKASGFTADLLEASARLHGWELKYIPCNFPDCIDKLRKKEIDILPAVAYSQAREKYLSFSSQTILVNWAIFWTRKDEKIDSLFDLDGKKIALLRKDVYAEKFLQRSLSLGLICDSIFFDTYDQVLSAVISGSAFAGITNRLYSPSEAVKNKVTPSGVICCPIELKFAAPQNTLKPILSIIDEDIASWKQDASSPFFKARKKWGIIPVVKNKLPAWVAWLPWIASAFLICVLVIILFLNAKIREKNKRLAEAVSLLETAEAEARKREAYVREIFDSLNDFLYVHDLSGNFIEVNAAVLRALGYAKKDFEGLNLKGLVPEKDKPGVQEYLERIVKNKSERGIMRILTTGGKILIIEYYNILVSDKKGRPVAVRGVSRDITESYRMQKELAKSEEKFRTILESMQDGYYEVDLEGHLTFFNKALARIVGYNEKELKGKSCKLFIDESEVKKITDAFNRVFMSKKPLKAFNWQLIRKDGRPIVVETSIFLITDKKGKPTGFRGLVRDISDRLEAEKRRKELEEQLLQAQKLESIGTLAGGIAHDFNNILFPIIGYTEMAAEELPRDHPARLYLDEVIKAAHRARDLVRQVLTFSKAENGHPADAIYLQSFLAENIDLLKKTIPANYMIITRIDPEAGPVRISPSAFQQIIMNLCINAYHAMEQMPDGKISISLEPVNVTPENMKTHGQISPGAYVKLTVEDTGEGISPSMLHKIFEPYFTTKPQDKGSGLGLSVVYGIVEKIGGRIFVTSKPGCGTRFDIYLPVAEEILEKKTQPELPDILPIGTEHILVVDDQNHIAQLYRQVLEKLGYNVTVRTSSIEALEAFRHNPHNFDLAVIDYSMPNLNGLELARAMKEIRPDIPVIICTGYSDMVSKEKLKKGDIDDFLMKPVARNQLAVTVRQILDEKTAKYDAARPEK